ncbi:hypothetical protein C7445_1191 [Alicyclobacillus sacchari]|uniref:Uncharacterized protein n=3 Tax=Alicyclobacillus sacchari TaxID=392010 RepID=A0A4R8LCB4_9BACL|nr:hypothetical protein C7445_1191 [Alicyclobacillus sacchari]
MACRHSDCIAKRNTWMHGTKHAMKRSDELRHLIFIGYKLDWSLHVEEREFQRAIPAWQSSQAFENGDCIHFTCIHNHGKTVAKWLWLGYAKVAPGVYRPLHLVIVSNGQNKRLTVATVYDPSQTSHMWDETYTVRLCWKHANT